MKSFLRLAKLQEKMSRTAYLQSAKNLDTILSDYRQALLANTKTPLAALLTDEYKTRIARLIVAYDPSARHDEIVEFINTYGDTSEGTSLEAVTRVAIKKGMPKVWEAVDKDKLNDFAMLWRIISEMLPQKKAAKNKA